MIAWGSDAFRSTAEDVAWKVSCLVVSCGGFLAMAGIYGLHMATKRRQANQDMRIFKYLLFAASPLYFAFTLVYLVSRVYLVYEVFRNLAYLDPRVYATPNVSDAPKHGETFNCHSPGCDTSPFYRNLG